MLEHGLVRTLADTMHVQMGAKGEDPHLASKPLLCEVTMTKPEPHSTRHQGHSWASSMQRCDSYLGESWRELLSKTREHTLSTRRT